MIHAYFIPKQDLFVFTGSIGNSRRETFHHFLRTHWKRCAESHPNHLMATHEGLSAWTRVDGTIVLRLMKPVYSDALNAWVAVPEDLEVPIELQTLMREAESWEDLNKTHETSKQG